MVLQAEELRIGNWVTVPRRKDNEFYDKSVQLGAIGKNTFGILEDGKSLVAIKDNLSPILITEDILLSSGFVKKIDGTWIVYINGWIALWKLESDDRFQVEDTYTDIYYVHQLQNLYFALTGEELEIEL